MEDRVQKLIVRQTCIKAVVELFKGVRVYDSAILSNRKLKDNVIKDIVDIAKQFEFYVYNGDIVSKERIEDLKKIVDEAIKKGAKETKEEKK